MALVKKNYIDRETVITADNLNAIQDAIIALENAPTPPAGDVVWGYIGGTLSNQTDLNTALSGKINEPQYEGINGSCLMTDGRGRRYWGNPGGGTYDYTQLDNKPKINGVELSGNKSTADLGINIPTVPTVVSAFTNDAGYITASDIPTIPTKTSQLTNDSGFLTQHQSLANYYNKAEIDGMIGNVESLLAAL